MGFKNCDVIYSSRVELYDIRMSSNGKGTSAEAAVASAMAEIVERLCGGLETGKSILAPFRRLTGYKNELLSDILLHKYMKGYRWTHQDCIEDVIGVESLLREYGFDKNKLTSLKDNSKMLRHWVLGYSLVHDKDVHVSLPFVKWISSTNGLAAGNTIEEAIIQATCEIFERDALIKFIKSDNPASFPTINQKSISNQTINKALEFLYENDLEVVIKDIGLSTYPVYALMTFNKKLDKNQTNYSTIKAGSSFNSDEAIIRCITERMQGTSIDSEIRLSTKISLDEYGSLLSLFTKSNCALDLEKHRLGPIVDYHPIDYNDTKIEIDLCIEIAKNLNTDLVVVDHTHPVLNFPVVRVVMPGYSDFMKWWDNPTITIDFIGNIEQEEDLYEDKLIQVLETFKLKDVTGASARNFSRRDR